MQRWLIPILSSCLVLVGFHASFDTSQPSLAASEVAQAGRARAPVNVPVGIPLGVPNTSVLAKVARTGRLVAGTRTDAMPFAYKNDQGEWVGYSIDLLERIRTQLEDQLQRPIALELVAVNNSNLEPLVKGDIDLVCGSTSFSRSRDLQVDFSIGYFMTGTQLLINTASQFGTELTIGAVTGTTNQQRIQQLFPIAQFVTVANRAVGLTALQNGRIDAFASDGILLEAMRHSLVAQAEQVQPERAKTAPSSQTQSTYEIVPNQPYDQEAYACMVRQDDPHFQLAVNQSLQQFMAGVLANRPQDTQVLERWFGEAGVVPIDLQPQLNYFQNQVERQLQPELEPSPEPSRNAPN